MPPLLWSHSWHLRSSCWYCHLAGFPEIALLNAKDLFSLTQRWPWRWRSSPQLPLRARLRSVELCNRLYPRVVFTFTLVGVFTLEAASKLSFCLYEQMKPFFRQWYFNVQICKQFPLFGLIGQIFPTGGLRVLQRRVGDEGGLHRYCACDPPNQEDGSKNVVPGPHLFVAGSSWDGRG